MNIIFDYFQPAPDAGDEENYAIEGNDMLGKFTCQHSQIVEEIYEKTIVKTLCRLLSQPVMCEIGKAMYPSGQCPGNNFPKSWN